MAEVTVEKVVEDVRKLTSDERQRLRGLPDEWLSSTTASDEDLEAQENLSVRRLLEKGFITRAPAYEAMLDESLRHPPVSVQGEPLSETVIRERR